MKHLKSFLYRFGDNSLKDLKWYDLWMEPDTKKRTNNPLFILSQTHQYQVLMQVFYQNPKLHVTDS